MTDDERYQEALRLWDPCNMLKEENQAPPQLGFWLIYAGSILAIGSTFAFMIWS